jgi:hypothetical protein
MSVIMQLTNLKRVTALILVLASITVFSQQSSRAAEGSTLRFFWSDNGSSELNRTFSEEQVSDVQPSWWILDVNTLDKSWEGLTLYLERLDNGKWSQVSWAPLYGFSSERPGLNASFSIDAICGGRLWCSGTVDYRIRSKEVTLKEFKLTYIPKKSNLKMRLKTDREQAWGTEHLLKATVSPKVSIKCSVERNGENVGTLNVKNGSGSMKFIALAYQKPATGRSIVTLYAVCKSAKYYGAAEVGFILFVP